MRKVKIKRNAAKNNRSFWPKNKVDDFSTPNLSVRTTLQPVPRDQANLEAEKGETVFGDLNGDSIPEHYNVGGKKHYAGGTPLNLPPSSFIFSDDKGLRIKDEETLKEFGRKERRKGYTPAEIAKQYDINEYRRILQDPDSDDMQRETAERMITNYNLKLGKLALVQESQKGFPKGLPEVAMPYLTTTGVNPAMLVTGTPGAKPEIDEKSFKTIMGKMQFMQDGGMVAQPIVNTLTPEEVPADPNPAASLGSPEFQQSYINLSRLLMDPNNQALRDAIYKDYKTKLPDSKLTQDQVITNFLAAQRQIYTMQAANAGSETLKGKEWDKGGKEKNAKYTQTAQSLGMTPLSEDEIKSFQAVYQSLQDLSGDEQFQPLLGDFQFGLGAVGVDDQTRNGKAVSPIDGIFGNTTVGQMVISNKPATPAPPVEKTPPKPGEPLKVPQMAEQKRARPADWWAQDIIKTAGAFGDLNRIKRYNPWAPPVDAYLPDATFYDPTRELAANAEQANIAFQGIGAFAGPQALSARASSIQGTAASNVANIMAKYNNLNVQTANQLESQRAQIINQTSEMNRGIAQDLYDKTQVVNQQFDNAKAMARQELRGSYIDAVTNRANAQVLNELYPQYNISPISGGMMVFNGGRDLKPTFGAEQNLMDLASDYMRMYPGFTPQQYVEAAKSTMGVASPPYGYMPDPEYLQNYMGMMSGVGPAQ